MRLTIHIRRKPLAVFWRGYVFREKVAKGGSMTGGFVVTSGVSGLWKNYGRNL
ncbi:MAG: hypothetical protein ABGW79_12815 [Pirellulales bacterium]